MNECPMKLPPSRCPARRAFTLIELLIVISIIAILAAMLIPAFSMVKVIGMRKKAKAELEQVAMAIDSYKDKLGHYPPDNPGDPIVNPLFYELRGTKQTTTGYETLDGGERIPSSAMATVFDTPAGRGIGGFVNCTRAGGADDFASGQKFISSLKPGQYGFATNGGVRYALLTTSVPRPQYLPPAAPGALPELNPICYNSSSPTNNPKSYDLWVDIVVRGKTNRISNWSENPEIN
jgi:prepilin-type N-terminal cleavage/methylation domain-containing protein